MNDFFTFYRDIRSMDMPFEAFSFVHFLFLGISIITIYVCLRYYQTLDDVKKRKLQIKMACYYIIEEVIYTSWLFLMCHEQVFKEVLPLELCSICAYVNVVAVFTQQKNLRFFSGVVGLIAGSVAMLYPANISGLYPTLSYRTINFYMLHASFIVFALIQLKDTTLLTYHNMKDNLILLVCLFTLAFLVNVFLKTQYMFVGTPPSIGFIAILFHMTGFVFFLPAILLIIGFLHFMVVYVLRRIYHVNKIAPNIHS